jgi:hypothetical protein
MKRTITILALAGVMMLLAIPAAFANSDHSNDTAGAGTDVCRPGADNGLIQPWLPIDMEGFVAEVAEHRGIIIDPLDPLFDASDPDYVRLLNGAQATWDFCDKNRDGTLCVMRTDPSPYYYTLLDNRPFPR